MGTQPFKTVFLFSWEIVLLSCPPKETEVAYLEDTSALAVVLGLHIDLILNISMYRYGNVLCA